MARAKSCCRERLWPRAPVKPAVACKPLDEECRHRGDQRRVGFWVRAVLSATAQELRFTMEMSSGAASCGVPPGAAPAASAAPASRSGDENNQCDRRGRLEPPPNDQTRSACRDDCKTGGRERELGRDGDDGASHEDAAG